MLAERLNSEWQARRRSATIDAVMRFSDEGLVWGAGVVLARAAPHAESLEPIQVSCPPVLLQYGPFKSEGGAFPPYIDIYGWGPLRINFSRPTSLTPIFEPPVTFQTPII